MICNKPDSEELLFQISGVLKVGCRRWGVEGGVVGRGESGERGLSIIFFPPSYRDVVGVVQPPHALLPSQLCTLLVPDIHWASISTRASN